MAGMRHAGLITLVLGLAFIGTGCHKTSASSNPEPGSQLSPQATAPAPLSDAPAPPPPRTFTLPAGAALRVRTSNTLSTKWIKPGQTFTASLEQPLVDGDWVIARKGANVAGLVVDASPGGRVKGVAHMAVRLTRLELADGRTVELSTGTVGRSARTTRRRDAAKIGIGSGFGAAIGAIAGGGAGAALGAVAGGGAGTGLVLATHGEPAVIAGESVLTFRLRRPLTIQQ